MLKSTPSSYNVEMLFVSQFKEIVQNHITKYLEKREHIFDKELVLFCVH